MEIKNEIKASAEKSVLCWLATADQNGAPNVSPKEIFCLYEGNLIIANIASPQSAKNIENNPKVCISYVDILVQKGWQLKGKAIVAKQTDKDFARLSKPLTKMTQGKFPFIEIFRIKIESNKAMIAPKYILYQETTEEEQIESAKRLYNMDIKHKRKN